MTKITTTAHIVLGPTANPLTRDSLPSPESRWTPKRKAEVIHAVRGGVITSDEAKALYKLTEAEYVSWERVYNKHGLKGLRVTHAQEYAHQ